VLGRGQRRAVSVNLLDRRSLVGRGGRSLTPGSASAALVHPRHDGRRNGLKVLLSLLVLVDAGLLRLLDELDDLVDGVLEGCLVVALPLVGELVVLEGVAVVVGEPLETVSGGNSGGDCRERREDGVSASSLRKRKVERRETHQLHPPPCTSQPPGRVAQCLPSRVVPCRW
jgi:hypothetical protein